jgi:hypothetical protein
MPSEYKYRCCIRCGVKLTPSTWFPSFKPRYLYVCKSCSSKERVVYYRKWATTHKSIAKERTKKTRDTLKLETLLNYSLTWPPQCANPFREHPVCVPYTTIEALSIDHINGGGDRERRLLVGRRGGGVNFYWKLKQRGYPKGYQILCMNCQFIKSYRVNGS